ncbi:MAG: DUF5596 domain-containing protein [Clostridia bacterium]|nr:DUF5596 domain-containing protein [Clostridia bacterium]
MDIMKREELLHVLNTLGCEPEDVTVLLRAFDRLQGHPEARAAFDEACALYRAAPPHDHAEMLRLAETAARHSGVHEYAAEFLLYACLSDTLLSRYRERGLSETLFWNTLQDLRYKLEECKAVKGIVGTFVASWFEGFFELTRFAFGRLQCEVIPFEADYEKDGKTLTPTSRVLNVHIPRDGTPLDPARCEEAYAEAAAFFRKEIDGPMAFVCFSWLLYPENETILSDKSNIVRFMKRYDVIRHGTNKNRPDLWRLFDTDEQNPDRLPTDTSARRAYVRHLQNGGKLGWGYGVFFSE